MRGGVFDKDVEEETPFGFGKGEGVDKGANESEWVVSKERTQSDEAFERLEPVDGKITGT